MSGSSAPRPEMLHCQATGDFNTSDSLSHLQVSKRIFLRIALQKPIRHTLSTNGISVFIQDFDDLTVPLVCGSKFQVIFFTSQITAIFEAVWKGASRRNWADSADHGATNPSLPEPHLPGRVSRTPLHRQSVRQIRC